ncbi:hypothetical protein KUTeg_000210 [Tegillarca granosa]|uniref:Uncharacterized protein n=1 Tax=Tegillarca granosa TaxID=220873 RepID=A0ABQ9FWX0_TEGGR|nr:hypothetical protein KUTeg_000210 [Tegillarca granosa]
MAIVCMLNYSAIEDGPFIWDRDVQAKIIGAFFIPYAIFQVPAAILVTKYGAHKVFGCVLLLTAVITLLIPIISRTGILVTYALTGFLCEYGFVAGWPSIFYVQEIFYKYLFIYCFRVLKFKRKTIPWKQILTSFPVYAFIIMVFASDWGFLFLSTFVPTYLSDVFQFGSQNVTTIVPALIMVGVGHVDCSSPELAIVLLIISTGMIGFSFAGFLENALDIDPQYATIIFGLGNVGGGLGGYLSSIVVGSLTVNLTYTGRMADVFYIAAAVEISGALFYLVFASSNVNLAKLNRKDNVELVMWNIGKENYKGVRKQEIANKDT